MKRLIVTTALVTLAACGGGEGGQAWGGTIDTLPSGMVVVRNPDRGLWDSAAAWRVTPVTRIGVVEGDGPDLFGRISAIELDPLGRIWVLDGQAQEIRVFDADGAYVRTVGRKGGGPGEFNQVMGMAWSPAGHLWVVDPRNNRISVIDTAGTFLTSHRTQGGFITIPWPGGFDDEGYFYNIAPYQSSDGFTMAIVRYDTSGTALDTLLPPQWQGEENYFEHVSDDGNSRIRSSVPFTPGLRRQLTRTGDFWFVHTGSYELFFRTAEGDTLLMATKPFEPVAVTDEDREQAIENLEWFTRQGGRVDASRIPGTKEAVVSFMVAEDGTVWVQPTRPADDDAPGVLFEVFNPDGRYLGSVRVPYSLNGTPIPVIRDGWILAVSQDEFDVQYVVLGRVENYAVPEPRDLPRTTPLGE